VEGSAISSRTFAELEAERSGAPKPLSEFERMRLSEAELARERGEEERRKRQTTFDASAEARNAALMSRVRVQNN
jgi:hypothetical protein